MVYIAIAGVDCEGYDILGIYYNKEDARKAMADYVGDFDFYPMKKISEDRYEFGFHYAEVKEYTVK